MDTTYFIALVLALVIGFTAAAVFVIRRGQSKLKLISWATATSIVVDFALLIDWTQAADYPLWLLTFDLGMFTLYGLVGCAVGALPVLVLRSLLRQSL